MTPDKTPPVSNCCHAPMRFGGNPDPIAGTHYRVCTMCVMPCDAAPASTPTTTGPAVPPFPTLPKAKEAQLRTPTENLASALEYTSPQDRETRFAAAARLRELEAVYDDCHAAFGCCQNDLKKATARVAELERANKELAADKERLDWLSDNPIHEIGFGHMRDTIVMNGETFASLRAAIDEARAKTAQ